MNGPENDLGDTGIEFTPPLTEHERECREHDRRVQQQAVELVKRLCGRAETCRSNAKTYTASMYLGEALRQSERAAAYDLAAEDACELLGVVVP